MNNINIYINKLKNILTYKKLENAELLAKKLLILCKKKKKTLYMWQRRQRGQCKSYCK